MTRHLRFSGRRYEAVRLLASLTPEKIRFANVPTMPVAPATSGSALRVSASFVSSSTGSDSCPAAAWAHSSTP